MTQRRKRQHGVGRQSAGVQRSGKAGGLAPGTKSSAMPAKPPAGDSTSFSLREWALSAGALLLIFSVVGTWGQFDFSNLMGYYDLLADAFLKGQLHIDIRPDQTYLHDMIPYGGRYYLQWGPFPALVHLLAELIGLPLSDRVACILAGWLTSLVFLQIMLVLRRRFFPGLPKPACLCFFFAFALGTPTALVSLRGTVYHESIVFGVLGVMGAFLALLHYQEQGSWKWALAAGLGIGVATASRVSLAVSGIVLGLVLLIIQYLRQRPLSTAASHVGAYSLPILVSGTLLMAYNQARFGSPWEYGNRYLPSITAGLAPFDPGRVPENLRHYLLAPIQLVGDFPWLVHEGWLPLVNTTRAEDMSSLLIGSPFLLLAILCWPLWRVDRPHDLKLFVGAAAISSSLAFGVMLCFASAGRRYAHDFVPLWMILAVVGLALQLEKQLPWRRWRLAAWGMVSFSALLHMHLSFTQSFTWDPPDLNVMKTFVAVSPTARAVMPAGPKWNEEEAIIRNEERLMPDGSVQRIATVYESDVNGRMRPTERTTTVERKAGNTTRTVTTAERPALDQRFQPYRREESVRTEQGEGSAQIKTTRHVDNGAGRLIESEREESTLTRSGNVATTETTVSKRSVANQDRFESSSRTVGKLVENSDGSTAETVEMYGSSSSGGAGNLNAGGSFALQQTTRRETRLGAGGETIENTTTRSRSIADPSRMGGREVVRSVTRPTADGARIETHSYEEGFNGRLRPTGTLVEDIREQ